MDLDAKKIFQKLNPRRIWIPVAIGVGIVVYLFWRDPNITIDKLTLVLDARFLPLLLAAAVFVLRFLSYMYRIRIITGNELSWRSSLYVIVLWEFASAVTPSVVGGTAVAVFILWKEGLKMGKSLGYVMLTAVFDNLFFIVAAPLTFTLGINTILPAIPAESFLVSNSLLLLFIVSYLLIGVYTLIMAFAIFINPRLIKWLLIKLTSNRFLIRWRYQAYERGNEMLIASEQIKGKSKNYWIKIAVSTIFIWSARYLMLNCLIAAFGQVNVYSHLVIFGKQVILWVIMLISPTPGSSGMAEYVFPFFFTETLADYTLIVNVMWRIFTYYPYLLLGAIFLPRWITRVFLHKKNVTSETIER
jgi:uncharacterized protein (TIRG00374 family)